jgi:penicillin-binding protein-related factor A (putative recombinase)
VTAPNFARIRAGAAAHAHGAQFELWFERKCVATSGLAWNRIADGCRTVGRGKLFRVRQPYDWVLTYAGRTALIDTKSFDSARLVPSCIEKHQLDALHAHELAGAIGGYAIYFRRAERVCFARASEMAAIVKAGKGRLWEEFMQLGQLATFSVLRIFEQRE